MKSITKVTSATSIPINGKLVVEGELILLEKEFGNLEDGYIRTGKYQSKLIKPIMISRKEKIEKDDWAYHNVFGRIGKVTNITERQGVNDIIIEGEIYTDASSEDVFSKVLLLPEHFSSAYVQQIIDLKMKNSDKFFIECYRRGLNHEGVDSDLTEGIIIHRNDYNYIELDSQNHATIHTIETKIDFHKIEVRKLIIEALLHFAPESNAIEVQRWLESNLK